MPPTQVQPIAEANEIDEMVTTERVAIVVRLLTLGRKLTTAEVAELAGIQPKSAWDMLTKISRVTPLYQESGCWVMYILGEEI